MILALPCTATGPRRLAGGGGGEVRGQHPEGVRGLLRHTAHLQRLHGVQQLLPQPELLHWRGEFTDHCVNWGGKLVGWLVLSIVVVGYE